MHAPKMGGMKPPHEPKMKAPAAPKMKEFGAKSAFKEPSSAKKLAGFKAPVKY